MIFTERTITVVNDSATINKPLILYRGDKNIELKITIAESQFKFRNTDASNVIETTDASYAQLVINTPYNSPIFSDVAATKNGAVIFVITEAMIDEIREVGAYEIQIRLLDDNKQSRASIPPVSNAIEIREPIAIEDGSAVDSNAVNVAKVNRALTTTSTPLEAFDSQGNYIKNNWGDGVLITDAALNKMEVGIDGVNKKIGNVRSQIKEKANKNEIWTMANMGQDIKEAMTGGSVAVVGKNTILEENIVDGQVTGVKIGNDVYNLINIKHNDYFLVNPTVNSDSCSNIASNYCYIIDKPIYINTVSKITKISLYCKKSGTRNSIYVSIGYFNGENFNIYKTVQFSCKEGLNTFETNIEINKSVINYIAISGLGTFSNDKTQEFYEIKNFDYGIGEYRPTKSSQSLTFSIGVQITNENAEKISMLESEVNDLKMNVKNYSTILNHKFTVMDENFSYDNCSINDGLELIDNSSCTLRQLIGIDDFSFSGIFKLKNLSSKFGLITLGSWASKYLVDLSKNTLNIYTNYSDTNPVKRIPIDIPLNIGEKYLIKLVRDGWDYELTITRINTLESNSMKFSNYNDTTERLYTRANGYFGVGCEYGEVSCTELILNVNNKEADYLFIGDSLTEGDQVENASRWTRKIRNKKQFEKSIITGIGGNTISKIYKTLENNISFGIKFKYCIVLAGMNNRKEGEIEEFKTNIDNIYNTIISQGAIPIIAINPIPGSGSKYIKQQRDYILSKGWRTIRFDIALSLNNDGETYDPSMFNSDGVHPNSQGNIKMYEETFKALSILL